MGIQELLEQLSNIPGLGGYSYSQLPNISPEVILQSMAGMYQTPESMLSPGLYSPISATQMEASKGKAYSPLMEAKGSSLLQQLTQSMGGSKVKKAAGGFAGSGQFEQYKGGAKDVYGAGFTDTLSNIQQSRSSAVQNMMDTIAQWQTSTSGITGPQQA